MTHKTEVLTMALCGMVCAFGASPALAAAAIPADAVRHETAAGQQAYAAHDYQSAVLHYEEALKLGGAALTPKSRIVLYSNLGAAYRESSKYPQAEQAFKKAIAAAEQGHIEQDNAARMAMQQYAVLLRRMNKQLDADLMEARANGATTPSPVASRPSLGVGLKPISKEPPPPELTKADEGDINPAKMSVDDVKKLIEKDDRAVTWYFLAYKYQSLKDWTNAIGTYQTISRKFPDDFKNMHGSLSYCYQQNGQLNDAIDEARRGMSAHPNDSKYYILLHDYQLEIGDIKGAMETDQSFLDKFPDDPEFPVIQRTLQDLKNQNDLSKQQKANAPSKWERIHNWPPNFMPLKVYVAPGTDFKFAQTTSGMGESTPEEIINRACALWNQASLGKISFQTVQSSQESNIECQFSDDPNSMEDQAAAGITQWSGYGEAPKARISLLVNHHNGQPFTREEFLDTCLHELGHALGLEHSQTVGDIMYPSMRSQPVMQLSDNDSKRIQFLYTR